MQRGSESNVVFVGVVKEVGESEDWETGAGVSRNTEITAQDWGAWFSDFNWSPLTYLAVTNGLALATITGSPTDIGLPETQLGLQSSDPAQIAYGWYTAIMGGASGILSDTLVNYGGQIYKWPATTTAFFETYPFGAVWPGSNFFISQAGDWYSKFSEILENPYYELIVGTSPYGTWNPTVQVSQLAAHQGTTTATSTYGSVTGQVTLNNGGTAWQSPGIPFTSRGLPNAVPAYSQIVGRVNPLPDLLVSATADQASVGLQGQAAYTYTGVNMARWNSLPGFTLDPNAGFSISSTSLSIQDYFNFFVLNPTAIKQVWGVSNSAGVFLYAYSGAANVAGIHRYGFKSMVRDTNWLVDSSYQISQNVDGLTAVGNLVGALTNRLASYYTPLPIMQTANGVSFRLSPSIFVGTTFTYSPFRGDVPWTFYVTTVQHTWKFGGPSITSLSLERGLPAPVYQNPTTMQQVLTGNAMRVSGFVVSGLPANLGPPLQTFGLAPANMTTILGEIAGVYKTPGAQ